VKNYADRGAVHPRLLALPFLIIRVNLRPRVLRNRTLGRWFTRMMRSVAIQSVAGIKKAEKRRTPLFLR
jgi:hypothetical protein